MSEMSRDPSDPWLLTLYCQDIAPSYTLIAVERIISLWWVKSLSSDSSIFFHINNATRTWQASPFMSPSRSWLVTRNLIPCLRGRRAQSQVRREPFHPQCKDKNSAPKIRVGCFPEMLEFLPEAYPDLLPCLWVEISHSHVGLQITANSKNIQTKGSQLLWKSTKENTSLSGALTPSTPSLLSWPNRSCHLHDSSRHLADQR